MTNSELILRTYREIVTKLDQPYYVLEGLSNHVGNNQILHSSPSIRNIVGLSQIELARNSKLFFDSIHPDHLQEYTASNQRLLEGTAMDRRTYLIKNQETGEFIPVEELATSRLNVEKNCFEIYCTVRKATAHLDAEESVQFKKFASALGNYSNANHEIEKRLFESTRYFVDTMGQHFKMNAVRFYGFNEKSKELFILADIQNKKYQGRFEVVTGVKTKGVVPQYSEDSFFFNKLLENRYQVFDDKKDIIEMLKSHTENPLLKKMAPTATKVYRLKSFGLLPISCPMGRIVGLITFGSPKSYSEEGKKAIYEFTTTNTFIFTPLLCDFFAEP